VPLTITANNQSKPYGAPLPVLTVSYSGFVNGDTAASLTTPPTAATAATATSPAGTYPITASGAVGANYTISYVAGTLTVTPVELSITVQPTNQTVIAGMTTSFAVEAAGAAPLSYQWWFDATNTISGATNATLVLTNVQASEAGDFSVIVTNVAGSVTSVVATLTVLAPPTVSNPVLVGQAFSISVPTVGGASYTLEYKNSFTDPDWIAAQTLPGTGTLITLTDNTATGPARFYRIRVQ
jgi:energy-converting hydrogenase Eha subunit E